jgi:hypothetical protein
VTYNPDELPTRIELEASWQVLVALGIRKIGDLSLNEYGRIIAGSPDYDANRYSDAERRFARMIVVLRAELAQGSDEQLSKIITDRDLTIATLRAELALATEAAERYRASLVAPSAEVRR